MRRLRLRLPGALLLAGCTPQPFGNDVGLQRWPEPVSLEDAIPGQWLVAVDDAAHPADSDAAGDALQALGAAGWEPVLPGAADPHLAAAWRFRVDADPEAVLDALAGRVDWLEPDRHMAASTTLPNDPLFSRQWHLSAIGIPAAWAAGTGEGVTVAVLDTGVSAGRDGFANLLPGIDALEDGDGTADGDGHGTHVAGTIAQASNNGRGAAGVAPGVALLPVQVLDAEGSGTTVSVARGIVAAVDAGADVLNLSLGTGGPSRVIADAVDYAVARGATLVAASGNDGADRVEWPAAATGVIAVGAVDRNNRRAQYSNGGQALDLVAPGGDLSQDADRDGNRDGVLQEAPDGRRSTYTYLQGTSMAAPHVSGVAALLIAQVGRDPERVRALLTETAVDLAAPGRDRDTGAGLVDGAAALAAALAEGGPSEDRPGAGEGDTGAPEPDRPSGLRFTELMINPEAFPDSEGEYIEVWNAGDAPVALSRLSLWDEAGNGGDVDADGILAPGAVAVLSRNNVAAWPWDGAPLDGLYPAALSLNNGGDAVTLEVDGVEVDRKSWSSAPRGASLERVGAGWGPATAPLGDSTDFGTPGRLTE